MTRPSARLIVTPELIADFHAYYLEHPTWGSLHIVLDDKNLADHHAAFCVGWAQECGDEWGERLARVLVDLSPTQRGKVARCARPSTPPGGSRRRRRVNNPNPQALPPRCPHCGDVLVDDGDWYCMGLYGHAPAPTKRERKGYAPA